MSYYDVTCINFFMKLYFLLCDCGEGIWFAMCYQKIVVNLFESYRAEVGIVPVAFIILLDPKFRLLILSNLVE